RPIGSSFQDRANLRVRDPHDTLQRQPNAISRTTTGLEGDTAAVDAATGGYAPPLPTTRHGFVIYHLDDVVGFGEVDVELKELDAMLSRVFDDQPPGVHPRLVGQHPGQELRRVMRFQP